MRQILAALAFTATLAATAPARADYYVEYYRDNLFLGLAYHRIGCLTNWATVQSNQEYDGFTTSDYCFAGTSSDSVPSGSWFDYQYLSSSFSAAQSRLDSCGAQTNNRYGTQGYTARSSTCSSIRNKAPCKAGCSAGWPWPRSSFRRESGRVHGWCRKVRPTVGRC